MPQWRYSRLESVENVQKLLNLSQNEARFESNKSK